MPGDKQKTRKEERDEKRAAALRENLKRRKIQRTDRVKKDEDKDGNNAGS